MSGRPLSPFYDNQQLRFDYLGQIWHIATFKVRVYFSCLFWCFFPILLSLLLHLIWNPDRAFEHEVKEWKAVTSLLRRQKYLNLTSWARFGTHCHLQKRVYSTSMSLCSQILLILSSLCNILICKPNGAFEHEEKELKAATSFLQ